MIFRPKESIWSIHGGSILTVCQKIQLRIPGITKNIITVEENALDGGFGSAVLELLEKRNILANVKRIGLPDKFIEHGSQDILRKKYGLTKENIIKTAKEMLA